MPEPRNRVFPLSVVPKSRALLLDQVPDGEEGIAKIAARLAEPNHVPTLRECDFSPTLMFGACRPPLTPSLIRWRLCLAAIWPLWDPN